MLIGDNHYLIRIGDTSDPSKISLYLKDEKLMFRTSTGTGILHLSEEVETNFDFSDRKPHLIGIKGLKSDSSWRVYYDGAY